jgi:hypothetical protein
VNDCIEYPGAKTKLGYGWRRKNGRSGLAHRYAWEDVHGPIPDGMVVMHTCDNRPCVNVDHLKLGTQRDNIIDMVVKGRNRSGSKKSMRCKRGHWMVPSNVLWDNGKVRRCRKCRQISRGDRH